MTKKELALRAAIENHAKALYYATSAYATFAGNRMNAARVALMTAAAAAAKDLNVQTDEDLFRAAQRMVRTRRRFTDMGDELPSAGYRNGREYRP